jgi:hypothetical protein
VDDRIRGGIEFGAFPVKFGANTCSFNSSPRPGRHSTTTEAQETSETIQTGKRSLPYPFELAPETVSRKALLLSNGDARFKEDKYAL